MLAVCGSGFHRHVMYCYFVIQNLSIIFIFFFFFFSSRRRHTRCREVSWARRCVQETALILQAILLIGSQQGQWSVLLRVAIQTLSDPAIHPLLDLIATIDRKTIPIIQAFIEGILRITIVVIHPAELQEVVEPLFASREQQNEPLLQERQTKRDRECLQQPQFPNIKLPL
eukprot:TRINITY_DN6586_c0_g1_i3.p3 TRINITY_DN6586_c0_g1~~TRINITY_DN6586_c0_g1_i3.p3  ORF type:complete len:171 (+),score=29.16 TRINITY_DN6586_c0_g1_i3:45-557(+)